MFSTNIEKISRLISPNLCHWLEFLLHIVDWLINIHKWWFFLPISQPIFVKTSEFNIESFFMKIFAQRSIETHSGFWSEENQIDKQFSVKIWPLALVFSKKSSYFHKTLVMISFNRKKKQKKFKKRPFWRFNFELKLILKPSLLKKLKVHSFR